TFCNLNRPMLFTNKILTAVLILFLGTLVSCKPSREITEKSSDEGQEVPQTSQNPSAAFGKVTPNDATVHKNLVQQKEKAIQNYRGSRERKFDLLHTSLDLRFDYENQWVIGEAILTVKPYFFEQETLELDAKDFDMHNVWLQQDQEERPLALRYDGEVVTLYLPRKFTAQDTLKIGIRYTAKPNENSGLGSVAITDNKGLYFINPEGIKGKPVQIWTQGETTHNSKWFPTIDSPNERAT